MGGTADSVRPMCRNAHGIFCANKQSQKAEETGHMHVDLAMTAYGEQRELGMRSITSLLIRKMTEKVVISQ